MIHDVHPDNIFDWSIMPRRRRQVIQMTNEPDCDERIVAEELEERKENEPFDHENKKHVKELIQKKKNSKAYLSHLELMVAKHTLYVTDPSENMALQNFVAEKLKVERR